MKKIILTIIYPLWYILSKTIIGTALMFFIVPSLGAIPFLFLLSFIDIPDYEGVYDSIGLGVAIISIIPSMYIGVYLMDISFKLELIYQKYNYKT